MIKIRLVCVGKLKEKFWVDAQNEYIKRLQKFCKFEIIELQEKNNTSSVTETLNKEGFSIIENLSGISFLFDREGHLVTSEQIAQLIKSNVQKSSVLTFVIGSSCGVSDQVKEAIKNKISLGKVTLPHNLARVVIIEQIYRAFNILQGTSYHK